jgi:hypothetical protein
MFTHENYPPAFLRLPQFDARILPGSLTELLMVKSSQLKESTSGWTSDALTTSLFPAVAIILKIENILRIS